MLIYPYQWFLTTNKNEGYRYPCYYWNAIDLYKAIHWNQKPLTKKKQSYFPLFFVLDIETTTIEPGGDASPYAYQWFWQLCIDGVCLYGRTMLEALECFQILNEICIDHDSKLIGYVFNLSFEFQFYRKLFEYFGDVEVFASAARKPMKMTCNNFEIRCAYFLSNMNLDRFCQSEYGNAYRKLAGDLDYKIVRDCDYIPTIREFSYNMNDVLACWSAIKTKMKNEKDDLLTIPLTSTGYIRRRMRKAAYKTKNYHFKFQRQRINVKEYIMLKEAARGGDTGANRYLAGQILPNVHSFDFQSDYPAQILLKEYPSTNFRPYGKVEDLEELRCLIDGFCCLFRCVFYDITIRSETSQAYISISKAWGDNDDIGRVANGRVLEAHKISLTLTEIDFKLITQQYHVGKIDIFDFMIAEKGPLPAWMRTETLSLYQEKSEIKEKRLSLKKRIVSCKDPEKKEHLQDDLDYQDYLYDKCKNRLNSIFGMCFQDPVKEDIIYNHEWDESQDLQKDPDYTLEMIEEKLDAYYNSWNSFLHYYWGVWIPAHARYDLAQLVKAAGPGSIYWDTDSDKVYNPNWEGIELWNKKRIEDCELKGAYASVKGKKYYLGVSECETEDGAYQRFKTLGAKKYAYEDPEGKLHITISGVNKKDGAKELGSLDNFDPGFIFTSAGKQIIYYNDDETRIVRRDGYYFLEASNAAITDGTYRIGITREYDQLLKDLREDINDWL